GFFVLAAEDGYDALGVAATFSGPIHLLVSDVILPTLNGRELYVRLRLKRPGLQALFMSGYVDNEMLQRGLVDERMNLIEKPFARRSTTCRQVAMVPWKPTARRPDHACEYPDRRTAGPRLRAPRDARPDSLALGVPREAGDPRLLSRRFQPGVRRPDGAVQCG